MMDLQSLYSISDIRAKEDEFSASVTFDPKHDVFKGHFPGQAVVPGVCLIRIIRDLISEIEGKPLTLESGINIKFLHIIDPVSHSKVEAIGSYLITEDGFYTAKASILLDDVTFLKFRGKFQ